MELLSLRALWKGLKASSLTFSLVFAMALMGLSLAGLLRSPIRAIGLWGPLVFLLPLIAIGWAARLEARFLPDARFRRRCSLLLIGGSILLTLLLWRYERLLTERYRDTFIPGPAFVEEPAGGRSSPIDPRRGPRNRP
jgi:hypothetical protein